LKLRFGKCCQVFKQFNKWLDAFFCIHVNFLGGETVCRVINWADLLAFSREPPPSDLLSLFWCMLG
jgi:hypothetical protein